MNWQAGLVLFCSFGCLIVLDFPIALALGVSSLITVTIFSIVPLSFLPQLMFATTDSFTLLAIPFFIFAGIVLGHTSISRRLIDLADSLIGDIPGGLGIVGIVAAVFFAGISGSGPADVAAIGIILVPAMVQSGYSRSFSASLAAAAGGIGIIIPPSIALIIYGFIAEVSITRLFIAGVIPGIIVACSLSAVTFFISWKRGYHIAGRSRPRKKIGIAFREAVWGLMAPVIILGGIYGGVFTPTEAAAVAVIYSIAVDVVVYRSMKLSDLQRIAGEAAVTSSVIMSVVVTASLFAWILNTQGLASHGARLLLSVTSSRWILLLIINGILICAGLFLDAISIFYIFLPILLPVVRAIGVDPIHFGMIMTVNLAIGQVTPPVGINLITAAGISDISLKAVSKAAVPFIAGECVALLLVTYLPILSLFIPRLFD